jgi:hypothetical protein
MWCPSCVQAQSHVQTTAAAHEPHPDLAMQRAAHGVVHTTGGRQLSHRTAVADRETQDARLADQKGWTHHVSFEPVHDAVAGARAYAAKLGLGDPHAHSYEHVMQSADRVREIGRHYDSLPEHQDAAVPHFEAMRREVGQQFHHLTNTMGIKVHVTDHDPYADVHELVHDVRVNKRLQVLGTHATGGHPHFSDHENDQFRAVHDFFGHAATGRSFDRHGEEAAFRAHAAMFSHHALPALASETRGQNASLILNGHFGPQKVALLQPHHYDLSQLSHAAVLMARYAAGWSGEDVIRHELGRQRVHTVNGQHELCPEHLRIRRSHSDFATGLAAQVGLEHRYDTPSVSPLHEGRCRDCARQYGPEGKDLPWERPPGYLGQPFLQRRPIEERTLVPNGWQHRRMRPYTDSFEPVDTTIRSLNVRAAIAVRSPERPWPGIRVQAHDSGDGETIFHCPFCGSGQVLARSDGTVECEFCSTAFTVQVQPQMPAFPQTIDGVPVDVPGMPAGGANANVPANVPAPGDPAASGPPGNDSGGFPPDSGGDDADDSDDSGDDGGGSDAPPWAKKSLLLRTAKGHALDPDQYMRHLALAHAQDRGAVLAQVRAANGAV